MQLSGTSPAGTVDDAVSLRYQQLQPRRKTLRPHAFRLTSEYDSESKVFFPRISCRLFDRIAKLKISFLNKCSGEISSPLLWFGLDKRLSVDDDVEARNALVKGSFDVGKNLQF